MEGMDFKKKEIRFTFEGKQYALKSASFGQLLEHGKREKKVKDSDDFEKAMLSIELLESCGLPREISLEMEAHMIEMLVREVAGMSKKK